MDARIAWVLNLDADLELEAKGPYAPTLRLKELMRPHVTRLAASLLGKGDCLVEEGRSLAAFDARSSEERGHGWTGRAFCPTRMAIAQLIAFGVVPEPSPPHEVLRAVNSRAFAASLGPTLPGSTFASNEEQARAALERDPVLGSAWRLKRAFGMAGRGQRVVQRGSHAPPDLDFVRRAVRDGGLQIEPDVKVVRELALHGFLESGGTLRIGHLIEQRCDKNGAWLSSERVEDEGRIAREAARLHEEVRSVGEALHHAGYFGPFGVDAYIYVDRVGSLHFQPRSEINARFSMGYAASGLLPLRSKR